MPDYLLFFLMSLFFKLTDFSPSFFSAHILDFFGNNYPIINE